MPDLSCIHCLSVEPRAKRYPSPHKVRVVPPPAWPAHRLTASPHRVASTRLRHGWQHANTHPSMALAGSGLYTHRCPLRSRVSGPVICTLGPSSNQRACMVALRRGASPPARRQISPLRGSTRPAGPTRRPSTRQPSASPGDSQERTALPLRAPTPTPSRALAHTCTHRLMAASTSFIRALLPQRPLPRSSATLPLPALSAGPATGTSAPRLTSRVAV